MADLTGAVFDQFELLALRGARGAVQRYLAADLLTGRRTYVRLLAPELAEPAVVDRFLARAEHGAHIFPPRDQLHVPELYRRGRTHGTAYTVSPSGDGDDLATFVERHGPLPWATARRFLLHVCDALQCAHRWHVAHGDLRAEHCLVLEWAGARGPVRNILVTDFGTPLGEPAILLHPSAPRLATVHDDLRALGRLALHMLVGEAPTGDHVRSFLSGETGSGSYRAHPGRGPDLPEDAVRLVRRLLTDDRAVAFPDARAVAVALAAVGPPLTDLDLLSGRLFAAPDALAERERAHARRTRRVLFAVLAAAVGLALQLGLL